MRAEAFGGKMEVEKSTMWGNKEMEMVESDKSAFMMFYGRADLQEAVEKVDTVDTLAA